MVGINDLTSLIFYNQVTTHTPEHSHYEDKPDITLVESIERYMY